MSDADKPAVGSVAWRDLTVGDAEGIRDFYHAVVGLDSAEVAMDEYSDFNMVTPLTGETVAGVCHARGVNQELPLLWLIYIVVEDLAESLRACKELGGSVIVESRPLAGVCFVSSGIQQMLSVLYFKLLMRCRWRKRVRAMFDCRKKYVSASWSVIRLWTQ